MSSSEIYVDRIKSGLELPWWFTDATPAVHADFNERVVSLPQHATWHSTQVAGVELRILEYIPGDKPRMTGQLRLDPSHSPALLGENPDLEILVLRGELDVSAELYPAGFYLRLPLTQAHNLQALSLRCTSAASGQSVISQGVEPALLYVAAGQMLTSDTEQRCVDTRDESRWLPGPVDGTDVLPLHGHGSGNAMLIRWTRAIAFKPGLDPMGEEVLVMCGSLYDGHGHYPAGSWIRNPVPAWQTWGAIEGTVVYYKNGHFSASSGIP